MINALWSLHQNKAFKKISYHLFSIKKIIPHIIKHTHAQIKTASYCFLCHIRAILKTSRKSVLLFSILMITTGTPRPQRTNNKTIQRLYSLSGKTSYRKISWSLEAARFGSKLFQSLWNLAGTSAALLPRCLPNFRAIQPLQHPISRLRDFTRFGG